MERPVAGAGWLHVIIAIARIIIATDARSTPAMALRMETVETLAEELFVLRTLDDDRSVRAVRVAGERVAPA